MRVNGIERPLGEPLTRLLTADPRKLDFAVLCVPTYHHNDYLDANHPYGFAYNSVFPGKGSKQTLPVNSMWSLRVWLRTEGVDHQLFRVEDLFVGKDLDFHAIGDASFARHGAAGTDHQVYRGYVGRALITFTVRYIAPRWPAPFHVF